jgi:tRNA pseudouridine55 synthase
MEGIVVVNKPTGMTSHDVVSRARKRFNMKRIGHAGTLDPLATGVLVLLIGRSTKLFEQFVGMDKSYRATLILGTTTDSADTQGKTLAQKPYGDITQEQLVRAFAKFVGEIDQVPPMVSAVKVKGKKLYELARSGIEIERSPRRVTIRTLTLESFAPPYVRFFLECSKGTYVRKLAEDIGNYLGCGACISQIERTQVGPFHIKDAVAVEDINDSHIRCWEDKAGYR